MPLFRVTRRNLPALVSVTIAGVAYTLPAGAPVTVTAPDLQAVKDACRGYAVHVRELQAAEASPEAPSAPQEAPAPEEAPTPAPEAVEPARRPGRRRADAPEEG